MEAPPPTKQIKALLDKFDAERDAEGRRWLEQMAEKEIYAMKRARVMGWKREPGRELKLL